jgi:MoaA/NifB/PqqE/SkfB family radical SAM enzyme
LIRIKGAARGERIFRAVTSIVIPPHGGAAAARFGPTHRVPAGRRMAAPPPPETALLELTSECNYRCGFCPHAASREPRGEMRWPLYVRIVGEMVDAGVEELGLHFRGEPFLCDWLEEAIELAKARGMAHVHVATNGSLATPARVHGCFEAGLDALIFSVDIADGAQFAATGADDTGLLGDAVANLKAARRIRDHGRHGCALYASSLRYSDAQQRRLLPILAEILPYVDEHYWRTLYMSGALAPPGPAAPIPCWSLFTQAHVTFDGRLAACGFAPGEAWAMADLGVTPFVDAWNCDAFRRLRATHLRGEVERLPCGSCVACP